MSIDAGGFGVFQVRIRFTDGQGNYSSNYTTSEITLEEEGDGWITLPFSDMEDETLDGLLVGNAIWSSDQVILTSQAPDEVGAVVYRSELPHVFEFEFEAIFGSGSGGEDEEVGDMGDGVYAFFFCNETPSHMEGYSLESENVIEGYIVGFSTRNDTIYIYYGNDNIFVYEFDSDYYRYSVNEPTTIKIKFDHGHFYIYLNGDLYTYAYDNEYSDRNLEGTLLGIGALTSEFNYSQHIVDDFEIEERLGISNVYTDYLGALSRSQSETSDDDLDGGSLVRINIGGGEGGTEDVLRRVHTTYDYQDDFILVSGYSIESYKKIYKIAEHNSDKDNTSSRVIEYTFESNSLTTTNDLGPVTDVYNISSAVLLSEDELLICGMNDVSQAFFYSFELATGTVSTITTAQEYWRGISINFDLETPLIYAINPNNNNIYVLENYQTILDEVEAPLSFVLDVNSYDNNYTLNYVNQMIYQYSNLYILANVYSAIDDAYIDVIIRVDTNEYALGPILSIHPLNDRYEAFTNFGEDGYIGITNQLALNHFITDETYNIENTILSMVGNPIDEIGAAASCFDDGYIYYIAEQYNNYTEESVGFVFNKFAADRLNDSSENIGLSGNVKSLVEESINYDSNGFHISDGGDDMYDTGNIIVTDLSTTGVPYTHTQQVSDSEEFSVIADGTVETVNGEEWFGEGSSYFTNMYTGLFVLAAADFTNEEFTVGGGLGADGSGRVIHGYTTVYVEEETYTVYYKQVTDASDPSVNHAFILPGPPYDEYHEISVNTDNDFDSLKNLSNKNRLYYLLWAGSVDGDHYTYSLNEIENIAISFLNIVHGTADLNAALSALNSNIDDVLSNIPNKFNFSDYSGGGTTITVVGDPPLELPTSMCYIGRRGPDAVKTFVVLKRDGDSALYKVNEFGEVTSFVPYMDFELSAVAYVNGLLYVSSVDPAFILILDPEKGTLLNENEDEKPSIIPILNDYQAEIRAMTYFQGNLFAITNNEDLIIIDIHTGECTLIDEDINDHRQNLTNLLGIYVSPPPSNGWYSWYEETKARFYLSDFYATPTTENLLVQYQSDGFDDNYPKEFGWEDAVIESITSGGEDSYEVILEPISGSNITIRVSQASTYSVDEYSAWEYLYED